MRIYPSAIFNMSPLDIARNPVRAGRSKAAQRKGDLIASMSAREATQRILKNTRKGVDLIG